MGRKLRIQFENALYHVTARGNAQQNIYFTDSDYSAFLEIYSKTSKRYNWICYSYCLMSNHYHFVIETPYSNLSLGMKYLNTNYAKKFNFRHNRVGHLFQGRYHATIINKDSYVLEVNRYIVLNPVRANMIKSPEQWTWSNYKATAGLIEKPHWLNIDFILNYFSTQRNCAQEHYIKFIRDGVRHRGV